MGENKLKAIIIATPTNPNELTLRAELLQANGKPITGTGVDYVLSGVTYEWTKNNIIIGNTQEIIVTDLPTCSTKYKVTIVYTVEFVTIFSPQYDVVVADDVCQDIVIVNAVATRVDIFGNVYGSLVVSVGIAATGTLNLIGRIVNVSTFNGDIVRGGSLLNGVDLCTGAQLQFLGVNNVTGTISNGREIDIMGTTNLIKLFGPGPLSGMISNYGNLNVVAGANLAITDGAVDSNGIGIVFIGNGGTVTNNGEMMMTGDSTLDVDGTLDNNGEIILTGVSQMLVDVVATLNNMSNGMISTTSLVNVEIDCMFTNDGKVELTGIVNMNGGYTGLVNAVVEIPVGSDGRLQVGPGASTNDGVIAIEGGSGNFNGTLLTMNGSGLIDVNNNATLNIFSGASVDLMGLNAILNNNNQTVLYANSTINVINGAVNNQDSFNLLGGSTLNVNQIGGYSGNDPNGIGAVLGPGAPSLGNPVVLTVGRLVAMTTSLGGGAFADTKCGGLAAGPLTAISLPTADFQPIDLGIRSLQINAPGIITDRVLIKSNESSLRLNPDSNILPNPVLQVINVANNISPPVCPPLDPCSGNTVMDSILVNNGLNGDNTIRSDALLSIQSVVLGENTRINLDLDFYPNATNIKWNCGYKPIANDGNTSLVAKNDGIYETQFESDGYSYRSLIEIRDATPTCYLRLRGSDNELYGSLTGVPFTVTNLTVEPDDAIPPFIYKIYFDEMLVSLNNVIDLTDVPAGTTIQVVVIDCCRCVAIANTFLLTCGVQ